MHERGRPLIHGALLATTILISAGLLMVIADDTGALGAPSITLDLFQDEAFAEMEEDASAEVLLNGSVTVLVPWSPEMQSVEVTLSVSDQGLNYNFEPSVMIFEKTGERTQYFDLTISVPLSYPAGDSVVPVEGVWRYQPGPLGGTVDEDRFDLSVTPVEDGEISGPPKINIEEGIERTVPVTITNTGNVDQFYEVDLRQTETIINAGVDLKIKDGGILEVVHNEEKEIDLNILGTELPDAGTFHIVLELRGLDNERRYGSISMSIEIFSGEDDDIPGDDDEEPTDDNSNPEQPSDDDEEGHDASPPEVKDSGNGFSFTLIAYSTIVVLIGILSVAGVVHKSRRK